MNTIFILLFLIMFLVAEILLTRRFIAKIKTLVEQDFKDSQSYIDKSLASCKRKMFEEMVSTNKILQKETDRKFSKIYERLCVLEKDNKELRKTIDGLHDGIGIMIELLPPDKLGLYNEKFVKLYEDKERLNKELDLTN